MKTDKEKIRVLRIINRFNIGGPTYNATFLTKFLSDDFECKVVNSAQQALDALSSQPFYLVVTDINLGSAQDGIWLGKYIKQSTQFTHIPVVAITAHVMSYTGKDEIKEAYGNNPENRAE